MRTYLICNQPLICTAWKLKLWLHKLDFKNTQIYRNYWNIHTSVYIYSYTHKTHTHTHTHTRTHTHTHIYIYTYIHAYILIYSYIFIYLYTYAHKHKKNSILLGSTCLVMVQVQFFFTKKAKAKIGRPELSLTHHPLPPLTSQFWLSSQPCSSFQSGRHMCNNPK